MDSMFASTKAIKAMLPAKTPKGEAAMNAAIVEVCIGKRLIAKLSPSEMDDESRARYTDFLVRVTKDYLAFRKDIMSWEAFRMQKDVRKTQGILFEFGVAREVFPFEDEIAASNLVASKSHTSLTVMELYELCQIQFHYEGTFAAFKRMIARRYGSFAEYCILKGFDINSTRWENAETAVRVARKLGTLQVAKEKSKSLVKYLEEHDLLNEAFGKASA